MSARRALDCVLFTLIGALLHAVFSSSPRTYSHTQAGDGQATTFKYAKPPIKEQRCIAFSVYDGERQSTQKREYLPGLVLNLKLAKVVYPGWKVIVYASKNLQMAPLAQNMTSLAHEVVWLDYDVDRDRDSAMFWRFWVADRPDCDRFIIRDTDSRLAWRERHAVDEWINTDKSVHIMRDHYFHQRPIMGGMWGAKKGFLGGGVTFKQFMEKWRDSKSEYNDDQHFFQHAVMPILMQNGKNFLAHDKYPDSKMCTEYGNCVRWPTVDKGLADTWWYVGSVIPEDQTLDCRCKPRCLCDSKGECDYEELLGRHPPICDDS